MEGKSKTLNPTYQLFNCLKPVTQLLSSSVFSGINQGISCITPQGYLEARYVKPLADSRPWISRLWSTGQISRGDCFCTQFHMHTPLPIAYCLQLLHAAVTVLRTHSRVLSSSSSRVLLPGKSHGWRSLVSYSPWGRTESDTTEGLHFHFSLSCTPVFLPGESQGWGSLVGCRLWGHTESDTIEATQQQQQQQQSPYSPQSLRYFTI